MLRRRAILPCLLILVALAALKPSQAQVLDNFTWVDLKSDTQTVAKVTQFLKDKPYTALREIGLVGQQALVVTTLRKDPTAQPGNDTFTVYGVSLKDGSVEQLLDGANLKYFDWQKFYDDDTPELLATYDDCAQCKATTFFTAFYLDRKTKRWGARWRREIAGAPIDSADASSEHIYALFINVDQRVVLDTWSVVSPASPQQKKSTRPAEYLFEYRIDPMSDRGTSRPLTGRDLQPIKERLCQAQDVVYGIAGGQDIAACKTLAGEAQVSCCGAPKVIDQFCHPDRSEANLCHPDRSEAEWRDLRPHRRSPRRSPHGGSVGLQPHEKTPHRTGL